MLGEIMSLRRPSEPSPASTTNSPPKFPLYLLPSLRIPFRRPRISKPTARSPPTASSETTSPLSSPVPSLSNSPSSSASASTTGPDSPTSPTSHHRRGGGRLWRAQPDTLRCIVCATDLAFHSQIVSKGFMGRHGHAYLVSPPAAQATPSCPGSPLNDGGDGGGGGDLVNVRVGAPERRVLVTGHHVVADISCATCGAVVGWKYVDARDAAQQYKVGRFILERKRVVGFHSWEDRAADPDGEVDGGGRGSRRWGWGADAEEDGGGSDDGESVVVFDSDDEDECEDIFAGVWDPEVVAQRRKSRVLTDMSLGSDS